MLFGGNSKRKKKGEEIGRAYDSEYFDYRKAKALLISGAGTDTGKHSGRKTGG